MTLANGEIAVITMIGWLPEDQKETIKTSMAAINWPTDVTGYFVPDNQGNAIENKPEQGFWYKASITDMARHYGFEVLQVKELDIFSGATKQTPRTFFYLENELIPVLEPRLYKDIVLKNDHAYYASFWLSMSFAWTIIFVIAAFIPIIKETFRRKHKEQDTDSEEARS
jgi:cytochrome oxidase assembly protein ShyY1